MIHLMNRILSFLLDAFQNTFSLATCSESSGVGLGSPPGPPLSSIIPFTIL